MIVGGGVAHEHMSGIALAVFTDQFPQTGIISVKPPLPFGEIYCAVVGVVAVPYRTVQHEYGVGKAGLQ